MNLIIDEKNKFNERVAILIDEYNKPLLAAIDNAGLYRNMQNILKGIYGVLKSAEDIHASFTDSTAGNIFCNGRAAGKNFSRQA
jgi:hypothetical protein